MGHLPNVLRIFWSLRNRSECFRQISNKHYLYHWSLLVLLYVSDLNVELQVLIHGIDMVEDVLGNAWDDAHELGIMQLALVEQKN